MANLNFIIRPVGVNARETSSSRGHGLAVRMRAHEDQDVALLQVARKLLGGLFVRHAHGA
jgi:hypothetical protein